MTADAWPDLILSAAAQIAALDEIQACDGTQYYMFCIVLPHNLRVQQNNSKLDK